MNEELLRNVIQLVNQIVEGAKTNNELPIQTDLDVNSKVRVTKNNVSETLIIKNIIDAAVMQSRSYVDRFIRVEGWVVSGNNITLKDSWEWYINGLFYTNTTQVLLSIPLCATGMTRMDTIVANNINTFDRIEGVPTSGTPFSPSPLPNTLEATFVTVTDTTITVSDPPTVIRLPVFFGFPADHNELEGGSERPLENDWAFMIYDNPIELARYDGAKWVYFHLGGNSSNQNLQQVTTQGNQTTDPIQFLDNDGNSATVSSGGVFITTAIGLAASYGVQEYNIKNEINERTSVQAVTTSYTRKTGNITGILTVENEPPTVDGIYQQVRQLKSGTQALISDITEAISNLPGTVDEILEYANLASFPASGVSNFYYLALDTNKTYRWSGTVYTPLNEGIALGETSSTAYRGDRGKASYDHTFDADVHVTTTDKANWNGKQPAGTYASGTGSATGTNTGDQDLSGKVDKITGKGLSSEDYTTLEKTKLSGISTNANVGVLPNTNITGATKTKVTYDAKGLITGGSDATTSDISDTTNKRYVTDANLTVIANTTGTNTGDNAANSLYQPTQTTGINISFATQKQWNSIASPATSNITNDLTGAVIMTTQKIYHNSGTAPTFPAGWVKKGTGSYVTGVLNTIYAEWSVGTTVEYWITQ